MIGLSCTAGAVLALCGQVRGTLERKGLPQKELDGGRVRIEPRYNQGSGFGLVPLNGRQMAPLSLAALWALLGRIGKKSIKGSNRFTIIQIIRIYLILIEREINITTSYRILLYNRTSALSIVCPGYHKK